MYLFFHYAKIYINISKVESRVMLIGCPNCQSQFEIDEVHLQPHGTELECSVCNHKWFCNEKGVPSIPEAVLGKEESGTVGGSSASADEPTPDTPETLADDVPNVTDEESTESPPDTDITDEMSTEMLTEEQSAVSMVDLESLLGDEEDEEGDEEGDDSVTAGEEASEEISEEMLGAVSSEEDLGSGVEETPSTSEDGASRDIEDEEAELDNIQEFAGMPDITDESPGEEIPESLREETKKSEVKEKADKKEEKKVEEPDTKENTETKPEKDEDKTKETTEEGVEGVEGGDEEGKEGEEEEGDKETDSLLEELGEISYDLENEEKRMRRKYTRGKEKGSSRGSIMLILLLALSIYALYRFRIEVISYYPPAGVVYQYIGLVEQPGKGLKIFTPRTETITRDNKKYLLVAGEIINTLKGVTDIVNMPLLKVTLIDHNEREVLKWVFRAGSNRLLPGEKIRYETEIPSPPPEVRSLSVTFVTFEEAQKLEEEKQNILQKEQTQEK